MHVFLNGDGTELPDGLTATQLVERLELTGRRIAMEVNGEIVPRSQYSQHTFRPDDRIEIVHAIGGG
ncbi:MAG TPA: sulfur carrier protein ThiS [Gammaproteobacteria bacterium]|nr:sulfur carrier protein ThiS [Gammaproteobacteria bacterium]